MIQHGDVVRIIWLCDEEWEYEDGQFPVYTFNKKEDGLWELTDKNGKLLVINPLNPNIRFIRKLTGDEK